MKNALVVLTILQTVTRKVQWFTSFLSETVFALTQMGTVRQQNGFAIKIVCNRAVPSSRVLDSTLHLDSSSLLVNFHSDGTSLVSSTVSEHRFSVPSVDFGRKQTLLI